MIFSRNGKEDDGKVIVPPIPQSDFVFFDPVKQCGLFNVKKGAYARIGKKGTNSGWRISFSKAVKERIEEKGCRHIRFCENMLTGEAYIVFVNDPKFIEVTFGRSRGDGYNIQSPFLCSKQAHTWLTEKLCLSDDDLPTTINLGEDLSRTNEQITYKIGKQQ